MYSYVIDVFIWSFAIYGLATFLKEYCLESICYIIMKCVYIAKLWQNLIDKKKM